MRYYIESSQALWEFEHDDNINGLRAAAGTICKALSRLSGDSSFWESLDTLRAPITESQADLISAFDEIELFLIQEADILRKCQIPESVLKKLLFDLNLSLKAFRLAPEHGLLDQLREGIPEAAEMICATSNLLSQHESKGDRVLGAFLRAGEALGVLGGAATIVLNGVSSAAAPLALVSVIGGAGSSLGFLRWMRRRPT